LDGTDEINEGQWEWASMAEPFEYSNWNSGEPNDSRHNEDCPDLQTFLYFSKFRNYLPITKSSMLKNKMIHVQNMNKYEH
jgi:hypothetical protein